MPDDLDDLVALDSDPAVMRYLTGGVPTPREAYLGEKGLLQRMCAWGHTPLGYYSARVDGAFVGWFHLRPSVFDESVPEVGYRLQKSAWGHGLATEGAWALCRWAFLDLGAAAVDACALKGNTASIGVMKKCGMRWVGTHMHPFGQMEVERYLVDRSTFFDTPAPR